MRTRLGALALILVLLIPASARAQAASPASLNLRLTDLPTGFTLTSNINPTAVQAAETSHETAATLVKWGRMASNEVKYGRSAFTGIVEIDSIIESFHTTAQALAQYRRSVTSITDLRTPVFLRMSIRAVGTKRVAWTSRVTTGDLTGEVDAVMFERGRYVVAVTLAGLAGTVDTTVLGSLAHVVDQRLITAR